MMVSLHAGMAMVDTDVDGNVMRDHDYRYAHPGEERPIAEPPKGVQ